MDEGETMRRGIQDRWNRKGLRLGVEELSPTDGPRQMKGKEHNVGPLTETSFDSTNIRVTQTKEREFLMSEFER